MLQLFLSLAIGSCLQWGPVEQVASLDGKTLPEASGLAASRAHPGRFYFVDDGEGDGAFYQYENGVLQRRSIGTKPRNLEAISLGSCGSETCLFLGDIGDNDANREAVEVTAVSEESGRVVRSWKVRYPDGPRNAESLLVTAAGDLVIVSKVAKKKGFEESESGVLGKKKKPGKGGEAAVYFLSKEALWGSDQGALTLTLKTKLPAMAAFTDMALHPNGTQVALLHYAGAWETSVDSLLGGGRVEFKEVSLQNLDKQEGIAYDGAGDLVWTTEAGGDSSFPLLRMGCAQK